jgi:tetraacyldisaccharide 4'-kinase
MIGRAPAFWWRPVGVAALVLSLVGWVVGRVAAARMARPPVAAVDAPVIVVGNPVVGGAGKTPTALSLAAAAQHLAPAILMRGWGGTLAGPVVVDPGRHTSAEVGDEALVAARAVATVVGRDRPAAARLAVARGAGLLILDDGFQNPRLARDVAILVVDAGVGVGNGLCLPAGPLRAPLEVQLARADALLIVGEGAAEARVAAIVASAEARGLAILTGRLEAAVPERFAGLRALAFAGIGRPEKFFATLASCGAVLAERRSFADHHPFSEADAAAILAACDAGGLTPVTTAKDHARLAGGPWREALARRARVLEVTLAVDQPGALDALVALARARAAARSAGAGAGAGTPAPTRPS